MSRRGTVLVSGQLTHLPLLLGDLETLVVEEFPEDAQSSWEKQRDIVIEETQWARRFGPPIPFPGSTSTAQHTAKELIQFEVAEASDDGVRITKKYSLKSGENDKVARFEMTGSGELQFDPKAGVIKKWSMTYEVKINESNVTVTIPVTVTARLFSDSEWAEFKEKQAAAAKAAQEAAAEAARPKPFNSGERQALIEQLTSADDGKLIAASDRLAKAVRDDNPDDFARPLSLLLSNSNAWVQAAAARALIVWATPESEDALVTLLKVDNFMYCTPAIQALATLKTEKAAEAVALQMPGHWREAGKALKDMGPVAEAATMKLLKNTDHWVRRETVSVLAEIGGEDSVRALEEIGNGLSEWQGRDIRNAINTIQRRLAAAPKTAKAPPRPAAKKRAKSADKKPSEPAPAATQEMRTWHDASGKFEIEATLVSFKDQTVTLKKKNGRTIRVPLEKLSAEDQKYVEEQSRAAFGDSGSDE